MINVENVPEEIVQFINDNKELECTMEDFFLVDTVAGHSNNHGIHNHTIENLFLYFRLDYHFEKNRVIFYPGTVFIVDNRKHKFFISDIELLSHLNFDSIPPELHKKFIFYSAVEQLPSLQFEKSKLKEYVYNLEDIFNPETYKKKYEGEPGKKIRKKIYQRLIYPFNFLSNNDFTCRDVESTDMELIEELHKKWVDYKLNDPKVFKMMFSSSRYNRCINMMFDHAWLDRDDFYCRIFYWEGKPIAVRQILIKDNTSYDIGFFSLFWEVPSNLILYINAYVLKELRDIGVEEHNCGMEMDKHLKMSKGHYPGFERITYKYNFKK